MAGVGSRRQIKVVQWASSVNAEGDSIEEKEVLYSGWAEIRQPSGFREYLQGQPSLGDTREFKIRNNLEIVPDSRTRVIYNGKQYTVSSIIPDKEKQFYYIIRATAQTVDGGRL